MGEGWRVAEVWRKCSRFFGSNYINYTNVMSSSKCHLLVSFPTRIVVWWCHNKGELVKPSNPPWKINIPLLEKTNSRWICHLHCILPIAKHFQTHGSTNHLFAMQLPNSQPLLKHICQKRVSCSHAHNLGIFPKPRGHIPECICGKTLLAPSQKFHNPLISGCPLLPCSCSHLSQTRKAEK